LTRVRASGLEEVNWQLHKAMRHAACALIVFFFFMSTTVVKHTRRSQGTLKEKEKSIPKQGGMDELEVGM
jgi:DNA integrity scanning protein DisA with diadenylate cyclase activity